MNMDTAKAYFAAKEMVERGEVPLLDPDNYPNADWEELKSSLANTQEAKSGDVWADRFRRQGNPIDWPQ